MAEYKFLDDLAKFGNSTVTAMGGFQKQVSKWVAEQTATLIKGMDIVTRQEIDGYKQSIAQLEERLAVLEGKLASVAGKAPKAAASDDSEEKPASKPKANKK